MLKNQNIIYGPTTSLVPVKLNFCEYILEKLWTNKENVCFINGATNEVVTYKDIAQHAINIALSLSRLGVRKGHTIAIMSENRKEFYPCLFGTIFSGAVATTINVGYSNGEINHVLNIAKPSAIFCSPNAFKIHEKTLRGIPFIKKIYLFGDDRPQKTVLYNDLAIPNYSKHSLLKNHVKYDEFQTADVKGDDSLLILYSSGTTGLPKGVILTHINLLSMCTLQAATDPTQVALSITPWFHVMGLVGHMLAIAHHRTTVYLPKFEPDLYLKCIEKYKIAQLSVVPPVLVALCKLDFKYDVSCVQVIYSGAAPLSRDTINSLGSKFPNAVVLQGYGMTEATLAILRPNLEQLHLIKPGSVGFVVPGCTVKVVDTETGKILGPNQRGEIRFKGPIMMKGYYGKDPRTSEDFDRDGYFKTGDIGYYDEDQCFFIVDRLKELIKYKGYQVPPAEIEALLLQHPGIRDAGVVGVRHAEAGEVPLAFVATQPGAVLSEEQVQAFVAERLSKPKWLRGGVRFVETIPKNPSGKILRKELRAMLRRQSKL